MRLSKLVQILLVSQVFVAAALASTRNLSANPSDISSNSQLTEDTELASELEEVLGEENVKEMVQMVLTDQMYLDHKMQQRKRQYKRDIYSSSSQSSTIGTTTSRTTARHSKPTITAKQKPVKFTAIPKNGVTYTKITNKNRVGSSGTRVTTKIPAKNPTKLPGPGDTKVKPTKYHVYPFNQTPQKHHLYFLPECAIQQVCNAVYVRLNFTQPLCACPPRYRDPCSASLNDDDNHTIKLIGNENKKAITLAKTCEQTNELRDCRAPRDWSILALQNTRTGKSHYLVICKCPNNFRLEGPLAHDQPTYAGLPGINVYGMLCVPEDALKNNKWKLGKKPIITTSYRSKNVTIDAVSEMPATNF